MLNLSDRPQGWGRNRVLQSGIVFCSILMMLLTGCSRKEHEVAEALSLARLMRRLAPEATDLLHQEQVCANELRINLEESGTSDFSKFRDSLVKSLDTLIAVRDRRRELQRHVRQGNWESPLVNVVQHDALIEFQNQLSRTEAWIQYAQNVRLRADLGRTQNFPEVQSLTHQLLLFLSEAQDDPLGSQIQTLKNEYRLTDSEIGN